MKSVTVDLYIAWIKDCAGKIHVDVGDEYPERVSFCGLETDKFDKVVFECRRVQHLDAFCDEHGFDFGIDKVTVPLSC